MKRFINAASVLLLVVLSVGAAYSQSTRAAKLQMFSKTQDTTGKTGKVLAVKAGGGLEWKNDSSGGGGGAAKQFLSGTNAIGSITSTRFIGLVGNNAPRTTDPTNVANDEPYGATMTPISGVFKNARARNYFNLDADTATFTLFKNGAATTLTFFITGAFSVGGNNTNTVTAGPDDLFAWRISVSGASLFQGNFSLEFDPD